VVKVLVVEDEGKVRRGLERGLVAEGYEVVTAADGNDGYRRAFSHDYDCIILDRLLPGRDGLEVLANLRQAGHTVPVLLLTARDAVEDRVAGLDAGADDYLIKPFVFAELLARIRALMRRGQLSVEAVLRADDLEMDLLRRRVSRGGEEVELTHREFDLLEYLLRNKNSSVTRDMLGRDVWKESCIGLTNVIDVHITHLRRKLERPARRPLILTVRGVGYRLEG
jgi:two-component system copper resistance phosphate regulon response regulator CusR